MKILKTFFFFLLISNTQFLHAQYSFKNKLISKNDFNKLKAKPLINKYGNIKSLKIVYDLSTSKLYYLNSKIYKFHYYFCRDYLNNNIELDFFNSNNYSEGRKKRSYLLANINYYSSNNLYTLEISQVDKMSIKDIIFLYKKIKNTTYFNNFKFFLGTNRLIENEKLFTIPTITSREIYQNQNYQSISNYKGFGKLKIIYNSLDSVKIDENDIIIIDKPLLELPIIAGLITTKLQTPLSHISILGKNRKIPIAAYTNALTSNILSKYNNQYVQFEVQIDTFFLKIISKKKFLRKIKKRKRRKKALKKDITTNLLFNAEKLNHRFVHIVGGKAANFGVLKKLSENNNFKVPEAAFAIPFYYYEAHIKKNGIDKLINKLIANYDNKNNSLHLDEQLKNIRNKIIKRNLDTVFSKKIKTKIVELGSYKRMRFRSSTNAEDIVGFSGAGLYDSKTGILGNSKKTIEKAIKKVWASLWNKRAFLERNYFNINQHDISMGVLVHRSFPNEKANGVAITKNLYRKNYFGFVINVQSGEESVVNPKKNIICDQIISYPTNNSKLYKNNKIIEIISTSNLHKGTLVLTKNEIVNLTKQLEIIKKYFYKKVYKRKKIYLNFAVDVEFKIYNSTRDLYIKQVRYFND